MYNTKYHIHATNYTILMLFPIYKISGNFAPR